MYISELVLEVTRKCNMFCDHCMRGDAQAKNMSRTVVDKLLSSVSEISSVTFTGGEPTLNVPIIRYFVQQVISRRIGVGYFYIVTNGMIQSVPLMKVLIDLYAHCYEKDMCVLVVSRDQYHDGCPTPLYEALRFYNSDERRDNIPTEGVINEGRAAYNNIGHRNIEIEKFEVDDEVGDQVSSMVYISSNGNVLGSCDLSYERIDREAFGNILDKSLANIIKRNRKE